MAKKKKRIITTKGFGFNQQKLDAGLAKFDRYFHEEKFLEAFDQLKAMAESYPDHSEVLLRRCVLYQQVGDYQRCLRMCDRYLTVKPDDPEMLANRGNVCLSNYYVAAAIQTFHDLLQRYPNYKHADDIREIIAEMQPLAEAEAEMMGLVGESRLELLALHEEAQIAITRRDYEAARQLEERTLEQHPGFPPALNTISQIHWLEGNTQQAIAVSQQVVEQHPDNAYALASLVEYYYLIGDEETARQYLQTLETIPVSERSSALVKKAEVLMLLGEDEGVLKVFADLEARLEASDDADEEGAVNIPPLLYHYTAVAQARLGNLDEAKALWNQAVDDPVAAEIVRMNLNDMEQPVSQRHAPYPFELNHWLTRQTSSDLREAAGTLAQLLESETVDSTEEQPNSVEREAEKFFEQHPQVRKLIPALLDRGDEAGRMLAMYLVKVAPTPETLEALKTFVLSDRGPDDQRYEAAQFVVKEGLLPRGEVEMWLGGHWTKVMLIGMEVDWQVEERGHSERVKSLLEKGTYVLFNGKGIEGEQYLKQALHLEPDAYDLRFNLSVAYELQERWQEARALVEEIHQQHPDYVFATLRLAKYRIDDGDLEAAEELLAPILLRDRLHGGAATMLCELKAKIAIAQEQPQLAKSWLEAGLQINPDSPTLVDLRRSLKE